MIQKCICPLFDVSSPVLSDILEEKKQNHTEEMKSSSDVHRIQERSLKLEAAKNRQE